MNAPIDHRPTILEALAFRPIEDIPIDAWADKYRFLSPLSSKMPGPFVTSRVEVARGILRAASQGSGTRTLTVKTCTQLTKTEVLLNVIGFHMHMKPCPLLFAVPNEAAGKSFSKERLAPMVRASPVLRDLLGDVTKDRSEDSLDFKQFPGGFLSITSANTGMGLAMRPIRVTLMDEIDKMSDLKSEGDPVLLAEERTSTFAPDDLHVRCCSPTVEGESRIDNLWKESDMRKPFVCCPHCGHWQTLAWKNVEWQKSEDRTTHFPMTAELICSGNGCVISEDDRRRMISGDTAKVQWRQTRPFTCCGKDQSPEETRNWEWDEAAQCGFATCCECNRRAVDHTHAGFGNCSKLYSPHTTVKDLACVWIDKKDDYASKQWFYNTQLGETFSASVGKAITPHSLTERLEMAPDKLPRSVLCLTAGADVQANRIEITIAGWGYPLECFVVDHVILHGDPTYPEVWNELDKVLKRKFISEWGGDQRMGISATCLDTGYLSDRAYEFAKARSSWPVYGIKGSSWADKDSPIWPPPAKSQKFREGFKPYIVNGDAAKFEMRQMLLIEVHGPGFVHIFKHYANEGYLAQLTSEKLTYVKAGSRTRRKWILPKGLANEAWDCLCYARIGLASLEANRRGLKNRLEAIAQLEASLQ